MRDFCLTGKPALEQPVAAVANSAAGLCIPKNQRRTRARFLSAFFVAQMLMVGRVRLRKGAASVGAVCKPCASGHQLFCIGSGRLNLTNGADSMADSRRRRVTDPHINWEAQRRALLPQYEALHAVPISKLADDHDEQLDALDKAHAALINLIITTPAKTVQGALCVIQSLDLYATWFYADGTPVQA